MQNYRLFIGRHILFQCWRCIRTCHSLVGFYTNIGVSTSLSRPLSLSLLWKNIATFQKLLSHVFCTWHLFSKLNIIPLSALEDELNLGRCIGADLEAFDKFFFIWYFPILGGKSNAKKRNQTVARFFLFALQNSKRCQNCIGFWWRRWYCSEDWDVCNFFLNM